MDNAILTITTSEPTATQEAASPPMGSPLKRSDMPPLNENEKGDFPLGDQTNIREKLMSSSTGLGALEEAVALAVAKASPKPKSPDCKLQHDNNHSHMNIHKDYTPVDNTSEATSGNVVVASSGIESESSAKSAPTSANNSVVVATPSKATSRLAQSRDENWENMFNCLLKYREEQGHCLVPKCCPEHKSLSHWVFRQRSLYMTRQRKGERKNTLTPSRIERLSAIGFVFQAKSSKEQAKFLSQRRKPTRDAHWTKNFEFLREFKNKTGHTLVPKVYKENQTFSSWVYTQRQLYRKRQMGSTNDLTDERIDALNNMGFVWSAKKNKQWKDEDRRQKIEKTNDLWQKYFDELIKFKEVHGHTMVPKVYKENQALSSWVFRQRKHFRLREQGLDHSMMDRRLQQLEDINFQFRVRGPPTPKKKKEADKEPSNCNENDLTSEEERKSGDEAMIESVEQSKCRSSNSNSNLDINENDQSINVTGITKIQSQNKVRFKI